MSAISLGACKVLLICYKYTFLYLDECLLCGSETTLTQFQTTHVYFSCIQFVTFTCVLHLCYMCATCVLHVSACT